MATAGEENTIASGREVPELGAGGGVEGVDVVVIAPDVDDAVGDGGGGVHTSPGREVPELGAGGGVEGVDVAITAPDVDDAVGDGGGGVHIALGRVVPLLVRCHWPVPFVETSVLQISAELPARGAVRRSGGCEGEACECS